MYQEEITMEIQNLINKLIKDSTTSPETAKIAIHGLIQTNNMLIDGYSYDHYIKEGYLKPLNKISRY